MTDASPSGFTLRPAQAKILEYSGGPMGVSAVPGSGKTFTLSLLAARLVERLAQEGRLEDREVLVVTFTNSAVENFRHRIGRFLRQEGGLLPGVGYRVRTLHGLAHDIVRERPSLVGLSEDFDIIDERTASAIKREASLAYLRSNPDVFAAYTQPSYLQNPRSYERYLIDDAIDLANAIIRTAKEEGGEAHEWIARLRQQSGTWPLLDFGLHVYADYQRSLFLRGAVDFDDLIVFALRALENDEHYLQRLQERWPYILEDEAQDSSLLQEKMLRRLSAAHGNWVRVGDPNQAINTTFTGADTRFLQRFLADHPEQARDLPNSGRSALPIIQLANALIDWSRFDHPTLGKNLALSPPLIEPTAVDDPQPYPPAGDPPIYLFDRTLTPEQEIKTIATSLQRWLPQHQEMTVAALVPENNHGFKLTDALEELGVPFDDSLLRSDAATRAGAQALAMVAGYIAQPQNQIQLEIVWRDVWWPLIGQRQIDKMSGQTPGARPRRQRQKKLVLPAPINEFGAELRKLRAPESFLFPSAGDWLDTLPWVTELEGMRATIERFRGDMQRWAAAAVLPVDELLLTLGNDLFDEPVDLALTHRLAVLMAKLARENPGWRLPELAGELENIAQNQRRILGFSEEAGGYEAEAGVVTVGTMHAAKGLEWDRVYLLAVNNFGFPAGGEDDKYRSERFYVRDRLNLVAEAEAQLHQLRGGTLDDYLLGQASVDARLDLAAERLRLLYVGITRARRELIITYNTGRNPEKDPNQPALAFRALARLLSTPSSP